MTNFEVLSAKKLTAIGKKQGLSGSKLKGYVGFFKARFPKEFSSDYAKEWANRFKSNPYAYADRQSTAILTKNRQKRGEWGDGYLVSEFPSRYRRMR